MFVTINTYNTLVFVVINNYTQPIIVVIKNIYLLLNGGKNEILLQRNGFIKRN